MKPIYSSVHVVSDHSRLSICMCETGGSALRRVSSFLWFLARPQYPQFSFHHGPLEMSLGRAGRLA